MRKMRLGLLGLLLPAFSWGQQVASVQSVPVAVPLIQPAAMAASAVLTAPKLVPTALPTALQTANPIALPTPAMALQPAVLPRVAAVQAAAAPAAAQPVSVKAQAESLSAEIADLAKVQAEPAAENAAIAKVFDASRQAPAAGAEAVSVDYPGIPSESLQGASPEHIQAMRSFRKELKAISHGAPLSKKNADYLIRKARDLGVPIRIHASDLQTTNNHWVGGPHIHIGTFHIPVEAGYVPTLMPGFLNMN